jgi:ABC-2 type transport system permease protein
MDLDARAGLPVWITHGRRDDVIGVQWGRAAEEALRPAGLDVTYVETEAAHHADPILSTRVGRLRWLGSHLMIATVGSLWLLVVVGLSCGGAVAAALGEPRYYGEMMRGALVQWPAVLVLTGIVVLAIGLEPRTASLGWAALVAFLLIGELGPLLSLDQWVIDISPYSHVPKLPAGNLTAAPLVWLTLVAVALLAAGAWRFGQRDLE